MKWYSQFLKKYGFAGFLITLLAVSFVVFVFVFAGIGDDRFTGLFRILSLPLDLNEAIKQPWSIFTYWFVMHPIAFWQVIIDLIILYTFGHILNAMLGDHRIQGIVLFCIVVNALFTIGMANLLPFVSISADLRLSGFDTINASLIAAAITLVPRYNFRVFLWDLPLVFVGGFLLLLSFATQMFVFSAGGISILVGAGIGSLLIVGMRRGIDPTSWLQFRFALRPESVPEKRERAMANHRIQIKNMNRSDSQEKPQMSEAEELDLLLDKINDVGYAKLSRAEKERLDLLSGKK